MLTDVPLEDLQNPQLLSFLQLIGADKSYWIGSTSLSSFSSLPHPSVVEGKECKEGEGERELRFIDGESDEELDKESEQSNLKDVEMDGESERLSGSDAGEGKEGE